MNFSFRRTALIVGVIMLGTLLFQVYWLKGLYTSMSAQLDKSIRDAMAIADQLELICRVGKIKRDSSTLINMAIDATHKPLQNDSMVNKFIAKMDTGKYLNISQHVSNDATFNKLKDNFRTAEKLAIYIQKGMHQAIDSLYPVDIQAYDSLVMLQLNARNISREYIVHLVQLARDSVVSAFPAGSPVPEAGFRKYDYPYDIGDKHAFRLYMRNPGQQVLWQMLGIISTSVAILGVLVYIFIYLLYTIRKMQTEEQLKTNFTNNMTHELKTPIAITFAAVDALLVSNQPVSPERQHKYLGIAKEQLQHLTGLVEQILAMSRKNNKQVEIKFENIALEKMVTDIYDKQKLLTNKQLVLKTELEVPTIRADKLHLYNMLNNLMENSVKYSGEKVEITVKAVKDGKTMKISVEDNGLGMESKYLERIFDKFYRIPTGNRHDAKGFGLGLFYVKEMAGKHGGTVEVTSQAGKGSRFTLIIPQ